MSDEDEPERTTWIPIAIAGGLVAVILAVVLTVDGSSDDDPGSPNPSPSSTVTP